MKPIMASKTVWLNLATVLAAALAVPEVSGIIPAAALPYLLALNAVLNIVVRVYATSEPVRHGPQTPGV